MRRTPTPWYRVGRMLTITSLTKRYGSLLALENVNLEVRAGEFFGLLGPNGAGKSTLMSLVAGLRSADGGTITIDGRSVTQGDIEARGMLGVAPQALALFPELTAVENLRIFGELQGLRGKLLSERIHEALSAVRLLDRRDTLVKGFSGGMQRRLNLVAALLHRPKLLLCDEPTAGVDPQSRAAIFEYLEQLNREGLTIIYSTHYMEEAARLCSRIGVIDHGRILTVGTLPELLSRLPFEDEIHFPVLPETAVLASQLPEYGSLSTADARHRFLPRSGFPTSRFFQLSEALGLSPRLFVLERPSLEAVFLHLTGRTLRDN